jgi:N-acetylglucosamine-6-phosphate deacetylase
VTQRWSLVNGIVHTGTTVFDDRAVVIEEGVIIELSRDFDESRFDGEVVDLEGRHLAPGLIDLQVNGGGGVLFNDSPSPDSVAVIVDAHRRCGTTDLLATFLTGPTSGMQRAGRAVLEARADGLAGLLGIHYEGPVLNPDRAGVHNRALIRSGPVDVLVDALTGICPAAVTLVTLAPEMTAPGFVRALVDRGAIVSAGHTAATPAQIEAAAADGLTAGTHVWNAMLPVGGRHPGPVGALLHAGNIWCGFIADGHHVDFRVLDLSIKATGVERTVLVSDAMPPVGTRADQFVLDDRPITVTGGRCQTAEGALAGAAVPLLDGVRNCVHHLGMPLDDALRIASLNPARCLRIDDRRGRIATGYPAHLIVIDDDIQAAGVFVGENYEPLPPQVPPAF